MKSNLIFLTFFLPVSLFGQETYIPDDNFEFALIQLGYDFVQDNFVTTSNINWIQTLDVGNEGISDLTGIEDFISLTELDCGGNYLTSLNISTLTALTYLDCKQNNLYDIDLSNNLNLTFLDISSNNSLGDIDLTNNINLGNLRVPSCGLSEIDLSSLINLFAFSGPSNGFQYIDVSNNTNLENLSLSHNPLKSLNVSNNIMLTNLQLHQSNYLQCLNLKNGNNQNLSITINSANQLTCIEVDNPTFSSTNWTNLPGQITFSNNCNYDNCLTSSVNELTTSKNLIQILDMMGRETIFKPNTPLIYVYDDGSTEKVFTIE